MGWTIYCFSVVLVVFYLKSAFVNARTVNVDAQATELLDLVKDVQESGRVRGVYPLNPIYLALPMLMVEFRCTEGLGKPFTMSRFILSGGKQSNISIPSKHQSLQMILQEELSNETCNRATNLIDLRRRGNFMTIVNETRTILNMKVRSDEAHFSFPNCTVDSTTDIIPGFSGIDIQLEGVMQDSDFNIQVTLDHLPTCNVTVNAVQVVDMARISFKIFEGVLPKMLSDQISKFLAKYNRKLMDDCVVKAVEDTVAQLSEIIDLCEIFHPNLRQNDEL